MEIIFYLIIATFFILSLIGSFIPIIPDVLPIWGGIAVYYFFLNNNILTQRFFISLIFITIIIQRTLLQRTLYPVFLRCG